LVALLAAAGITPGPADAQDYTTPPVDYYQAVVYTLRRMPPDELIRIAWAGTGDTERMLAIARRESHFNCAADNPHSSAAGLFQTIGMHRRLAESHGLDWGNITGPDCLDDVLLAKVLYDGSGLRPWRT
jgi:hypothetical protein